MGANGDNVRTILWIVGVLWRLTRGCLANMKVITLIYLHCRPDLRDEWLSGTEVDDVVDAMVGDPMRSLGEVD